MGEILDSFYVYYCHYSTDPEKMYRQRTEAYLNALGDLVDIWEIGNEVNGEWVGWRNGEWEDSSITAADMQRARDTVAGEVHAAYDLLKRAGKKTAITFYFNEDGQRHSWTDDNKRKNANDPTPVSFGKNHAMLTWAARYRDSFPDVDYVLISYYQDDNFAPDPYDPEKRTQIIPSPEGWAAIFGSLHDLYPNAKFGFGEMSPQCYYLKADKQCLPQEDDKQFEHLPKEKKCGDRRCDCCLKAQIEYIERYYLEWDKAISSKLGPELAKRYVGGYFYWYFNEDVIDKITAGKDECLPKKDREALAREAEQTMAAFVRAFHRWPR
jgi:hypothetical protein